MRGHDATDALDCEAAKTLLFDEPSELARDALAVHLEGCPVCRSYAAAMRDVGREVGALARAAAPPWTERDVGASPPTPPRSDDKDVRCELVRAMPTHPNGTPTTLTPSRVGQYGLVRWHGLRALRARPGLVVASTALSVAAAALFAMGLTPVYTATAQILIEPPKPTIVAARTDGHFDATTYYNTQLQLLRSERTARRALDRLRIDSMPNAPLALGKDALVAGILQGTSVALGMGSHVFNVSYSSSDPDFSARVANAMVDAYADDIRDRSHGVTDVGLRELRERAAELEPRVQAAQEQLRKFLAENALAVTLGSESGLTAQLEVLRSKLGQLHVERQAQEALAAVLAQHPDSAVAKDIRLSALLEQLRPPLRQAELHMAALRAAFGVDCPMAQQFRPTLEFLRKTWDEEVKRQADRIALELAYTRAMEKELTQQVAHLEDAIVLGTNRRVEHSRLVHEASALRESYEGVLRRIEQIALARAPGREDANIFVIERARPARAPTWPNIPLTLLLGLVAGVFVGAALTYLLDKSP